MKPSASLPVVVRFAPSPTGALHVGGARTALFNYLFAKHQGGQCLLRIDDTDKTRSKPEFEASIRDGLKWLGLAFDAEYRQSERTAIYRQQLERLIADGTAYKSEEPNAEGVMGSVIRLKNPGQDVTFHDLIRGNITFNTTELGDFVIAKDLDTPLYHFASVVDDDDLNITHVIRGEDHIANTPRQILIAQALGATPPHYAHIPLILAADRSKLSKRHGAVDVIEYKKMGYLAPALVNFLALLGWSPQSTRGGEATNEEIFSLPELIKHFDIERVQKSGAIFNTEKLNWLNKQYLQALPPEEFETILSPRLKPLRSILLERFSTIGEMEAADKAGEFDYFFSQPTYDKALLKTPETLTKTKELIEALPADNFTTEAVKQAVWDYATAEGKGKVLWPLRIALTGREKSPDPFTVAAILGRTETLNRLAYALGD